MVITPKSIGGRRQYSRGGSADKRITGTTLQNIRRKHFAARPLCVMCEAEGRVTVATELDHIVALTNGGTDTQDNRQGLCSDCHDIKTAQDLGYTPRQRQTIGTDGWPVK